MQLSQERDGGAARVGKLRLPDQSQSGRVRNSGGATCPAFVFGASEPTLIVSVSLLSLTGGLNLFPTPRPPRFQPPSRARPRPKGRGLGFQGGDDLRPPRGCA